MLAWNGEPLSSMGNAEVLRLLVEEQVVLPFDEDRAQKIDRLIRKSLVCNLPIPVWKKLVTQASLDWMPEANSKAVDKWQLYMRSQVRDYRVGECGK